MARTSPPIILPRALIFLASIWLIGSWLIAIGLMPPVHPSSSSYEHGLRMMMLCVTTGLMIGWPLLRLSQVPTHAPIRQTLLDLIVIASMVQVILWPLRLVTTWSIARTAAVDATLVGWTLLAGATIAATIGTEKGGPRMLAMFACLCMCLLGPALGYVGAMSGVLSISLINLSPLMAVRALGDGGGAPITSNQWQWILLLFVSAGAAWTALGIWTAVQLRKRPPGA